MPATGAVTDTVADVVEAMAADPDTITGPSSVAGTAGRTLVGDTACAAGKFVSFAPFAALIYCDVA